MHAGVTAPERPADPLSAPSAPAVACVSCGEACRGAYCSECGQRQPVGRHTLQSVISGTLGGVFSIDHGLGHTAALLTIRPGAVITGYWAGQTVRYTHPARYLLITVAVFALAVRVSSGPIGAGDNDRFLALLIIPFVAAVSRVLLWQERRSYAEHLIAVLYLCGHVMLGLAVLAMGTRYVSGNGAKGYGIFAAVLSVGYFLWGYSRAFPARRVLASIAGLGALALGTAAWLASMMLLVRLLG
jgi:hypothetical protein